MGAVLPQRFHHIASRLFHRTSCQTLPELSHSKSAGFAMCLSHTQTVSEPEKKPKDHAGTVLVEKISAKSQGAKVGKFQELPMVATAEEILGSALKRANHVQATKGISNIAKRERNRATKQVDALMKELSVPLGVYFKKFPRQFELHPYERSLLELTLGTGKYEEVLEHLNKLRKKIIDTGKNYASLCNKATTKREACERREEAFQKLEEIFNKYENAVEDLKETAKKLRILPVVDLDIPIMCLVGAPNVGKSSLVRLLSTGKPEVCNYPFTTRTIFMGHIVIGPTRYQVTDTPGLLKRKDEERNNMEKLTLAALSYLPTAVLYVHDLTGDCGTSPKDQLVIYKEMKERYGERPWIDVVSKSDMLPIPVPPSTRTSGVVDDGDEDENIRYSMYGPEGSLRVSAQTLEGISELTSRVHAALNSLDVAEAQLQNDAV